MEAGDGDDRDRYQYRLGDLSFLQATKLESQAVAGLPHYTICSLNEQCDPKKIGTDPIEATKKLLIRVYPKAIDWIVVTTIRLLDGIRSSGSGPQLSNDGFILSHQSSQAYA